MLSPKLDSFYHTEQKTALGYQNPFYLKQAQQKQQGLSNGKVILEKHDPPAVYDSKETLQLTQESHLKMKQLNKEIKLANYAKINKLSKVFVSQNSKSREELYFSNTSKMASVPKSISIPNEEFLNDTSLSVARKFLNEVKSTIVTLQLNQVDARVQNFEIQLLKEAAKFVRDLKSLEKEAGESLAKHKDLEFEIERLLKAVVNQDIMSIVQSNSVVDTLNLQTELNHRMVSSSVGKLKGKSKDTPCVSDTLDPLSQKLKDENVALETSEDNNIKLAIRNEKSKVVCATCKQCLITDNHDECLFNYVNGMNSSKKNQSANVSKIENQKKHKPNVKKSKKLGSDERLASPRPSKPRTCLRWLPTGRIFDLCGKITASSNIESESDTSVYDIASASNHQEPTSKGFPNSTSFLDRFTRLRRQNSCIHSLFVL
ncbi:hypothetical protein Tco_1075378 [Tanacetum coccineum]